jgi:hypothetical protein
MKDGIMTGIGAVEANPRVAFEEPLYFGEGSRDAAHQGRTRMK